ncbi:MAG TPA: methylated-DNA--[protein]-cysteine S-methyltransferase [Actinomycetota bacterium]|nr:methylated-DNA--[protein]-cysteine S-methyltransferase [Actinomycetota bacterium]
MLTSPFGELTLTSDGEFLTGLEFGGREPGGATRDARPFDAAAEQLDAYFARERTSFDVPIAPAGTPFQRRVWGSLQTIPYGTVTTYTDLARRIDAPAAVRAVGRANATNPIAIVVPCHRVVGRDGALRGFRGGVQRKAQLLALEGWSASERAAEPGGVTPADRSPA